MTADLREGLEAVVGLLAGATAGEWCVGTEEVRGRGDGSLVSLYIERPDGARLGELFGNCCVRTDDNLRCNAALIAACVNLIRQHGPALLAQARDAERLDWLESLQQRTEPGPQKNSKPWPIASDVHLRAGFASVYVRVGGIAYGKGERDKGFHGPTLREAIDAALSQPGAGAE